MDIDAVFLPVAEELIDQVFPTPITYLLTAPPAYDPSTGESVPNATEYMINAGILSRGKNEGGGSMVSMSSDCGFITEMRGCQRYLPPETVCFMTERFGKSLGSIRLIRRTI